MWRGGSVRSKGEKTYYHYCITITVKIPATNIICCYFNLTDR